MIQFRCDEHCKPRYMTALSAGADLVSTASLQIPPGEVCKVPTGVWIAGVDWDLVPEGYLPELQIRARSGLAAKHGIMLANGVGTVDADYPDEICALLYNSGKTSFAIKPGDRIAQVVLNLVMRLPTLAVGKERTGGFGSTKVVVHPDETPICR